MRPKVIMMFAMRMLLYTDPAFYRTVCRNSHCETSTREMLEKWRSLSTQDLRTESLKAKNVETESLISCRAIQDLLFSGCSTLPQKFSLENGD